MKLKAEHLAEALVDWVKTDIKEVGKQSYDIGKFFFTVSVGSMGLLATLQKLDPNFAPDLRGWAPYLVLFVSLLLALNLVFPRNQEIGGTTDLAELHESEVRFVTGRIWLWFASWFVGAVWSLYTLLAHG